MFDTEAIATFTLLFPPWGVGLAPKELPKSIGARPAGASSRRYLAMFASTSARCAGSRSIGSRSLSSHRSAATLPRVSGSLVRWRRSSTPSTWRISSISMHPQWLRSVATASVLVESVESSPYRVSLAMKIDGWIDRDSHPTLDALFSVLWRAKWPVMKLFPSSVRSIVEAKAV